MKGQILQMAWVVENLEAAIEEVHRLHGVGPFLVNRHIRLTNPTYRGRPHQIDFSTAVAQAGGVQWELIEQHDDLLSCYRDLVAPGRRGLHHTAYIAEDFDAEVARLAALGYPIACDGMFGDLRFAYVDTSAAFGHMLEILEDKPMIHKFFGAIRKAAEGWDGKELIRELG